MYNIRGQEKNCHQLRLQYSLAFISQPIYPVGREGMGEIVILARYRVYFIIEHKNLVYDPSNNKSILTNNISPIVLSEHICCDEE